MFKYASVSLLSIATLFVALASADKLWIRHRAAVLIRDIEALEEANGDDSIFLRLREHDDLKLTGCDGQRCEYEVEITNRPLPQLHLAERGRLFAFVGTDLGRAAYVGYELDSVPRSRPPSYLHVQYGIETNGA